jgi:uncharacterized protein (DUF58 family)
MAFLDPVDLSKVSTFTTRARIVVDGALSGLHRARLRGSSVEFSEHKEYSPGDDLRHIDWKVFAKADRYYVKQFEQESELTAYLILDASGSMAYQGDGIKKLDYAAYLLAALAYLLIQQRDRVGLYVYGDDKRELYVPPRGRPKHLHDLLAVFESVCTTGASGDESLTKALDRVGELARRKRSLIFLASDLFADNSSLEALVHLRARGHDVTVFHTLDAHELSLPFEGLTQFEALEGERSLLTNPTAIRKQYQQRMQLFLDEAQRHCRDAGIEYRRVETSTPVESILRDFLAARSAATPRRRR